MEKINNIIFIYNDLIGGVNSVIEGIIKNNSFKSVSVKIILTHKKEQKKISRIINNTNDHITIRFEYSQFENLFNVYKRLLKKINATDIIIANDWLELAMASNLGISNRIIFIVHGNYEYYYNLAIDHQINIDKFVGVSEYITNKLNLLLPSRINDICYIPNGVASSIQLRKENINKSLQILFIGRLTKEKGFFLLPQIDKILIESDVVVQWTIIGDLIEDAIIHWKQINQNINFTGKLENNKVLEIISNFDIFILPSHAEGFPIALIEAMKAGLVPLVTDLQSGIPEVIINNQTGFVFNIDDALGYANAIIELHKNRQKLETMSRASYLKVNNLFRPADTAIKYIEMINRLEAPRKKTKNILYASRLDHRYIPNFLTIFLRQFKVKLNT